MAGVRKLTPIEAFETNMADAYQLVKLVEGFRNQRARRMRTELRDRVGEALRVRERDRDQLDCLQSADVFVTFMPGSGLSRADFTDPRPLLRQAIVAACAATETYLGDKVMQRVGARLVNSESLTSRLGDIPMSLRDWMKIEDRYQRRRVGLREHVIEPYVREQCSTAASKVGAMLSLLGVENWSKRIDATRHVPKGQTAALLDRITDRRNGIAHQGDRVGRGRAALTSAEVRSDLDQLESIVHAIELLVP